MAGKPQVTAKIGADASGVQKALKGVRKQFSGFATDVGKHMKRAAVAGMAGVTAALAATLKNGFDQKVMLEQSEALMTSLMGGADKAKEAMAMLSQEAKDNPMFSKKETMQAGANLAMFAKGSTKRLKGLVDTAQLLSVLNPTQGLEGAAFALKEAEGGDYVSLAERFNISKTQIRNLREAGLEGKALVDAVLKLNGVSDKTLGDMAGTMGGQMAAVKNQWDEISLSLIEGFWPKIQETAGEFMSWISENKGQIIEVLTTATELIIGAVKLAIQGFDFIQTYLGQLAAFFAGWWESLVADFSIGRLVAWLSEAAQAAMAVMQGFVLKVIAMILEKVKEYAPKLFGFMGGDKILGKVNAAATAQMDSAKAHTAKAGEISGIGDGKRQVELTAEQQRLDRANKPQVAELRVNVAGMNGGVNSIMAAS